MKDIFSVLHVDSKEDNYTFCLEEFLSDSAEYREKAAGAWGFENGNYSVLRTSILTDTSKSRTKITPDLILYNQNHIAVIESKMFSSEGSHQTEDYLNAEKEIKERLKDCNQTTVEYYFFTLAGVKAEESRFIVKRWADYYKETLDAVVFESEYLNAIAKSIYERAIDYLDFEQNYKSRPYCDLTWNENCWIGPFAIFSSGMLNTEWDRDPLKYHIYNGKVVGRGHSTFRTDIADKEYMWIEGKEPDDNIYLFTRIEWNYDSVDIFLNYEYWNESGYVPFSRLSEEHKQISIENRSKICEYLSDSNLPANMEIPARKKNMLHMLKTGIDISGKTLDDVITDIKEVLSVYESHIAQIYNNLTSSEKFSNGYCRFQYPMTR